MDALCIIQDSDEDKDFQISRMRSIFENAFITLVAASGEDACCGFLSMPPPPEIAFKLPYEVPYDVDDDFRTVGYRDSKRANGSTLYASRDDVMIQMEAQPINKRAWTLEERLLSPRRIIFFADRISWECDSSSLADSGGITNMGADMRLPVDILRQGQFPRSRDVLMWCVHTEWAKNIEWYSCREMTKPMDKLRAIGGIAQKYQQILHAEYFAGLWSGYVVPGLLWRRVVEVERNPLRDRPPMFRAPSWSWAAIDGKIDYDVPERDEGALEVARLGFANSIAKSTKPAIEGCEVVLKSSKNPFGGVSRGYMIIRGMARSMRVSAETTIHEQYGPALKLRNSDQTTEQQLCEPSLYYWPDSVEDLIVGNIGISLLVLTGGAEDERAEDGHAEGAVLRCTQFLLRGIALTEQDNDRYSRIGFFELWHRRYVSLLAGFAWMTIEMI